MWAWYPKPTALRDTASMTLATLTTQPASIVYVVAAKTPKWPPQRRIWRSSMAIHIYINIYLYLSPYLPICYLSIYLFIYHPSISLCTYRYLHACPDLSGPLMCPAQLCEMSGNTPVGLRYHVLSRHNIWWQNWVKLLTWGLTAVQSLNLSLKSN